MDKMDLIKCAISVAGKCTDCKSVAEVFKTVAIDLVPNVIDFIDEKTIIAKAKKQRELQQHNDING